MTWILLTLIYMAIITIGSLVPAMMNPDPNWIKEALHNTLHIPAYAFMAFLLVMTAAVRERRPRWVAILMITVFWGGMIELLQGLTPGRTASWGDVIRNAVGAMGTLILFRPGSTCGKFVGLEKGKSKVR